MSELEKISAENKKLRAELSRCAHQIADYEKRIEAVKFCMTATRYMIEKNTDKYVQLMAKIRQNENNTNS